MPTRLLLLCCFILAFTSIFASGSFKWQEGHIAVILPANIMKGIPVTVSMHLHDSLVNEMQGVTSEVLINGAWEKVTWINGKAEMRITFSTHEPFTLKAGGLVYMKQINPVPLWWSVIPPLITIVLALVFKEVVVSLTLGILGGAMVMGYYAGGWLTAFAGFFRVIDTYVIQAMYNSDHIAIIVFSMLIGGIVALIGQNGGAQGIVNLLTRVVRDARSAMTATWFLGISIFFDDYANTLIVGNTMRPVTDRMRVSREKLAYLVDSTAAPVAAIAFITAWIGAELGYIQDGINAINSVHGPVLTQSPFSIFISSLRFSFYPVFALIFMFILIRMQRDFGPMLSAELRARSTGKVTSTQYKEENNRGESDNNDMLASEGIPLRAVNAILPIVIVVFGTIAGLIFTGYSPDIWTNDQMGVLGKISLTFGNADSYLALLWGSFAGLVVALGLTISQRIMNLEAALGAVINGFKSMVNVLLILILAWGLAAVTEEMHTAIYLTGLLSDTIAPWLIPALAFTMAALVAFATGSSWGTMAILYPLMLPLSFQMGLDSGLEQGMIMLHFLNVVASILAGAVLGDHCSPISDTTILSSLASQCHHIDHVRTQLPYALVVGAVALFAGVIPTSLGVPFYVAMPAGIALLYVIARVMGKRVPTWPSNAFSDNQ